MCKPPKEFDLPEAEQTFRFVWFEEFPCACYFWWEDRNYFLPYVLFGHKNVGKSLQKSILELANSSKNIQKRAKYSNGNTKKEANIFS